MKRNLLLSMLSLFGVMLFSVTTVQAQVTYCNSNFTTVTWEHITNVTFAGINNNSVGNTGGPVNYTAQVANVVQGNSYPISVTILPDADEYIFAFIDWNQNGVLNDAGEVYTIATAVGLSGPHTANIAVPAGALLGNTRMRVMLIYDVAIPNPCHNDPNYIWGEAEDYTVNVSAPAPTYCVPTSTNGCGDGDEIDDFIIATGGINHLGTGCSANGFGDYTALAAQTGNFTIGQSYAFSATHDYTGQWMRIYIDLNNNGSFEDAGEQVFTSTAASTPSGLTSTTNGSFTIPPTATAGSFRMRVMTRWNALPVSSCDIGAYGEAHDYTVVLAAAPPPPPVGCPVTTVPTAIGSTSCATSPAVLTATAGSATNMVLWQNSGGYAVGSGSVFTAPLLPSAASYSAHDTYVIDTLYSPGPSTTITTGGFGNFSNGTYFTAISPFMWDSVTLRSNGAVSGQIRVWDANPTNFPNANLLQSAPFSVGVAGDVQVPVGLSFSPGSYYVNLAFNAGGAQLWRSTTTNVGYPFVVPNVMSIDSSWLGAGQNLNRIYYLLDWKIKEMCIGDGDTVVAASSPGSTTTLPYSEDFENGLPCDWSRTQNAGSDGFLWGNAASLSSQFYPIPAGSNFMASNDDECNCDMSNDMLISPMFDFTGYSSLTSLTLSFDYFLPGIYDSEGFVMISTNGGATFTSISTIPQQSPTPPMATVWASHTVDLSAYAGMDSVHFAFKHDDNGAWADGLAIDNVSLIAGCGGEDVTITVVTDIYGSETTWELRDATSGAVYASGGPYTDITPYNQAAATYVTNVCVPSGTFVTFRINDSYGDGLFDGVNTGTFDVSIDCGGPLSLFSGSGAFPFGGGTPAPQLSWDSANFVLECPIVGNNVDVTFQVNMSETTVSPSGVHVMGDFNSWSPSATPMVAQGGGIYAVTLSLPENTNYEYKFVNGNQTSNAESVPSGCSQNGNRLAAVGAANVTLPLVCFGSCANCTIGLEELSLEHAVIMYPNPASGMVSLDFTFSQPKDVSITVVDPVGKTMYAKGFSSIESSVINMEISTWATGIYFVKIQSGAETIVRRLVVNR